MMFFMFVNAVILQLAFFYILIRLLNLRESIAKWIAGLSLASLAFAFFPPTLLLGGLLFSYSILYYFLTTKRIGSSVRFAVLTFFFCFITFGGLAGIGLSVPAVKLHYFNLLLSTPFNIISAAPAFQNRIFAMAAEGFITSTALYWHRYSAALGLYLCICYAYITLLALNRYAPRVTPPPDIAAIRVPFVIFFASVLSLVSWRFVFLDIHEAPWLYLFPVAIAILVVQGLGTLVALSRRFNLSTAYIFIIFSLSLFMEEIMWLLALAGAADGLLGVRIFFSEHPKERVRQKRLRLMLKPQLLALSAMVLMVVLAAFLIKTGKQDAGLETGFSIPRTNLPIKIEGYEHEEREGEVFVSGQGKPFYIDRYEYPNKEGMKPQTGVNVEEARNFCKSEGKRLCDPDEWAVACMSGTRNFELFLTDDPNKADDLLSKKCAMDRNHIGASGSYPECKNEFGVFDMVGNVWEIVELRNQDLFGIMGPGTRSGCKSCNRCDWILYYYPAQIGLLKKDDIGFRCCRGNDNQKRLLQKNSLKQ